jgi:DNA mismatch repair protein MLH1
MVCTPGRRLCVRNGATPKTPATTERPYENNLIRTDSKVRKITAMLGPAGASVSAGASGLDGSRGEAVAGPSIAVILRTLESVKNLRASVRSEMHNTLTEMFASHTYVGLVDERRRLAGRVG